MGVSLAGASAGVTSGGWDRLRTRLTGDLVLPADSGYDLAKQNQFGEFDAITPRGIVYAETTADVSLAVRFAREHNLRLRTRSGGHNYRGWSTGEGLVVDLSRIHHATATGSTVHLGPGAQSIDALYALAPLGLQVIAGTCPTVCPGGFLSGGGIGYQTKKFGVGCDHVVSAQIVLADGSVRRVSADNSPDLFWALRGGGGGNFGIVTDFEVTPIDAPRMVAFTAIFTWDRAAEILAAWQQWHLTTPDELGSALVFMLDDAAPGNVPTPLITGGFHGPEAGLRAALDQLSALVGAAPVVLDVQDLAYHEGMRLSYGCAELTQDECHRVGTNPSALLHRTALLREGYRFLDRALTTSEIGNLLAAWDGDRVAGQRRFLHGMTLGGANTRTGRQENAFVHREAQFILGFDAQLDNPTPELIAGSEAFVDRGMAVLDPVGRGSYVNFPGYRLPDWAGQYYAENYPRLLTVKRRYDPDNVFRHPRSIGSPSA
ncbi:MAG: FAD-binding oxidoreductase [Streptomycetaceae bacterium]|nr:FAD-binding oxidoreductase [Streptomycetaceae bacterium]